MNRALLLLLISVAAAGFLLPIAGAHGSGASGMRTVQSSHAANGMMAMHSPAGSMPMAACGAHGQAQMHGHEQAHAGAAGAGHAAMHARMHGS